MRLFGLFKGEQTAIDQRLTEFVAKVGGTVGGFDEDGFG